MKTYTSIANWAEDDRPREKLLLHGRETLSTAELLAILLGSGSRKQSALDLAKSILAHYGNDLNQLSKASPQELCKKFKGVGTAKAVTILAAIELAIRKDAAETKSTKITSSEAAFHLFAPRLSNLPHEEFWIALLTNANKVITTKRLSLGGTKGTVVDKALLLKMAIEHLASTIILCHNHPSKVLKASEQDKKITQTMKELCDLLDIRLLDHIIICGKRYLSFADNGFL